MFIVCVEVVRLSSSEAVRSALASQTNDGFTFALGLHMRDFQNNGFFYLLYSEDFYEKAAHLKQGANFEHPRVDNFDKGASLSPLVVQEVFAVHLDDFGMFVFH